MRFVYCNGHNSTSLFFGSPGKKEKMNISIKEETLGQRIRAQRIRLGMTQEELAEALYVEKSIISYYENDKKEMRASSLAELAKVLQTTPNYLLGFADNNDGFADEALGLLRDVRDQSVREILLKGQMKNLLLVDPVKMVSMTILRNVNLKKYLGAT